MDEASLLTACCLPKITSEDRPCKHVGYGRNAASGPCSSMLLQKSFADFGISTMRHVPRIESLNLDQLCGHSIHMFSTMR